MLALLLAAIGLYRVMNYTSFDARMKSYPFALGASASNVLWMVLSESLLLLALGMGCGIPLALATIRFIRAHLFNVSPFDAATFVGAIAIVAGMTLLAAWPPARRTASVGPMVACVMTSRRGTPWVAAGHESWTLMFVPPRA